MPEKKRRSARRLEPGCGAAEAADGPPLEAEIALLRALIDRVAAMAASELALEDLLRVLDAAGLAGWRLANLLKTQRMLAGGPAPAGVMSAALAAKIDELRRPPG